MSLTSTAVQAAWIVSSDAQKAEAVQWMQEGETFVTALTAPGVTVQPSASALSANSDASLVGSWVESYESLAPSVNGPPILTLLGAFLGPIDTTGNQVMLTWQAITQDVARHVVPAAIQNLVQAWVQEGNSASTDAHVMRDKQIRQWFAARVQNFPLQAGATPTAQEQRMAGVSPGGLSPLVIVGLLIGAAWLFSRKGR